jgi:hypothetical protein
VKYPDSHYAKVAKTFTKAKTIKKTQDHYPSVSERTIQRWVKKARELGYLEPWV